MSPSEPPSPAPVPDPAEPPPETARPPGVAFPEHPLPERPIPRGCNPLVFGIVAATVQLALTLYFMRSC